MPTDIDFGEYFDYDQLSGHLRDMAAAYPELAVLSSIGKSWQGRAIHCMTLTNGQTGPHDSKPAFYIDGHIHAEEGRHIAYRALHDLVFADELWRRRRCNLAARQSQLLYHPTRQSRWRRDQPEDAASLVWQRPLPARRRANSRLVPARYQRRRSDRADAH